MGLEEELESKVTTELDGLESRIEVRAKRSLRHWGMAMGLGLLLLMLFYFLFV